MPRYEVTTRNAECSNTKVIDAETCEIADNGVLEFQKDGELVAAFRVWDDFVER